MVDDDALVRTVAAAILEPVADEIFEASGAGEAWELLESDRRFDAAVIDIRMPDVDGVQLAAVVAEMRPEIAIVVVSGKARLSEGELPERVSFLPKPYGAAELVDAVAKAVAERRSLG